MKKKSDYGRVHVNKPKVDGLKLFIVGKQKLQGEVSSSTLSAIGQVVEDYESSSKKYFDEIEQRIDEIFPSEGKPSNLNIVQMLTAQKERYDLHLDDTDTALQNITSSTVTNYNMISAYEVQKILQFHFLPGSSLFSASLNTSM